MKREKEFEKVKEIIKTHIRDARCGIFFSRNTVGDIMLNLYTGEIFTVDICRHWEYYEVFGCTDKEAMELDEYYEKIKEQDYKEEWEELEKEEEDEE